MKFNFIDFNKIKPVLFYVMLFFFTLALGFKYNALDVDLWARLINGQHVFHTGLPLFNDIVSYTPTSVWIDPEWLSSLLIFIVQKKFSIIGLSLLKCLSCFLMLIIVQFALTEKCKQESIYNISFFILMLGILVQSGILVMTVRCQLVTFIFLALWILLLEKIRAGKDKYLHFLPFIMLIWLNSHGGSIAGVGILFLYGIGEFLNHKPFKKYFITLFFVCLVYFINPWGLDFIPFILKSAVIDRSWIAEWQSSFSLGLSWAILYKILLFLGVICYILRNIIEKADWKTIDKVKLLLILVSSYLSIKYSKHIGIFTVIFSIFLYEDCYFVYNFLMEKLRGFLRINLSIISKLKMFKDIFLYSVIFLFSCLYLLMYPAIKSISYHYLLNYPLVPYEFLKLNDIKGKILLSFADGSYIVYKGYPDLKIYMDGRQEQLYSMETFDELMFFLTVSGDYPQALLKKNPPDIILIPNDFRANILLEKSKNYSKIYDDRRYNMFIKNELKKFYYQMPEIDKNKAIRTIFDTKIDFRKKLIEQ